MFFLSYRVKAFNSKRKKEQPMDDERIVELYWQRNEAAIACTEEKYGPYCLNIAGRILGNPEDAEECVNDVWLKAWASIPPNRPKRFRLYLAKLTRNRAINRYQELRAAKRGFGEADLVLGELAECLEGESDVEDEFVAGELRDCIRRFADGLPEREALMFIRSYFYLDRLDEIADRFNITQNNASVSLSRIRDKLRKKLAQEGFYP